MQLGTTFDTSADPATAFAYLADFSRIVEWDPFVVRAETLDEGAPRVGTRYRIVGRVLGRPIRLDYRIVELDPPRRVRLVGTGGRTFDGWDEVTLAPAGSGTTVRYEAEIALHGWGRLLWLLAPLAFLAMRVGLRGGPLAGLKAQLDALDALAPARAARGDG